MNPKKIFNVSTRFGMPLAPSLSLLVPILRIGRKFFPPNRHPIFGILLLLILIVVIASGIFWILSTFFNLELIDFTRIQFWGE